MASMRWRPLWSSILGFTFFLAAAGVAAGGGMDDGLLEPGWFGQEPIEFHTTEELDFFWVKPGFSLAGKTIHVEDWPDPIFLGPKDKVDGKDSARAFALAESMPGWIRGALSNALADTAKVSKEQGDVVLAGRFVDVNAGSRVAKMMVGFGAGSASATWDMKLTDAASGELLAAIHHRAVSGTQMSDIDDKILKWLDRDLGPALAQNLAVYAKAKRAKG